ncbi:hypothetical protein [Desulfonatronum parangueonense]
MLGCIGGCWDEDIRNAGMKDRDEGGDLKPEGRRLWEGKDDAGMKMNAGIIKTMLGCWDENTVRR